MVKSIQQLNVEKVSTITVHAFFLSPRSTAGLQSLPKTLNRLPSFEGLKLEPVISKKIPPPYLTVVDSKNELPHECFCPSLGGCKYV